MSRFVSGCLVAMLVAGPVLADNKQQSRMKECNAEAKEKALAGDDRKAFMKDCLSAAGSGQKKGLTTQQEKMKQCNASAKQKDLKGEARKSFMKECLSGE